jgi:hypothetical protein
MQRCVVASSLAVTLLVGSGCTAAIVHPIDSSLDATLMIAAHGESSGNHVARAELLPLQEISIDEALRQIRPEWLRVNPASRPTPEPARASVYVDDLYVGELDALRLIPVSAVTDLRFLAPSVARDRLGPGCHCSAGVILVMTRTHD